MQLQDVQAFVRPANTHPNNAAYPVRGTNVPSMSVGEATFLPNCTPEVADAIKARMCEGAEVRDLRNTVSAQEYENLRADNERLRAEVERLEQVASELQESFNEVCAESKRDKARRSAIADALGLDPDAEHSDMESRARELRRQESKAASDVSEACAAKLSHALGYRIPQIGRWHEMLAEIGDRIERAYNQGCADTVAAFRKAQGEG